MPGIKPSTSAPEVKMLKLWLKIHTMYNMFARIMQPKPLIEQLLILLKR